ncbi:SPL family radical SAM protein [Cellulosilyticum sp. I15G10I2]|uniref:SPL family radical SAM protein n=1 Tax=Cellulosilyticum sp. I15G10I2 TaxID=1892843 RepID=UPI00085BB908|nr:radical SAM protein [Cellulosilyticum sp. I15G10I2]
MIREIIANKAITYEYPPDGGEIPIIDPYDGCTMGCPYCFQLDDDKWNKQLLIKTNMPDLIRRDLRDWPKDKFIYIGSRCDPYMNIEEKYKLTRRCIIELNKLQIPIMITTKSNLDIIFRDIDILKGYTAEINVLLGLSNMNELSKVKTCSNIKSIDLTNKLHNMGIGVWAFITPVLPGITDVDLMIESLNCEIPVYLDKLRINPNSKTGNSMLKYIKEKYPRLEETYLEILYEDKNKYIEELRKKWKNHPRIKFVFD